MISLKKLFGTQTDFFQLLESMASQGRAGSTALKQLVRDEGADDALKILRDSRVREREIAARTVDLLCSSNSGPFGRDDVEVLARNVQAVPRAIRKFGERYGVSRQYVATGTFHNEVQMLETATDTLHLLVSDLRNGSKVASAKKHNDTLQKIEGEVDKIVFDRVVKFYHETNDPVRAIVLKDLYELLDRSFDRCRSAGNFILRLVMKHS